MTRGQLVLAFDIERSGATLDFDTIAIGASVVDDQFHIRDTLFLPAYYATTQFETRCWNQFWSKNKPILEQIRYTGLLDPHERQRDMIYQFQEFRSKWEIYAKTHHMDYVLVSDNPVYDGGFINDMVYKYSNKYDTSYTPTSYMPIPYNASDGEYSSFLDTHSELRGFFMAYDPQSTSEWGLSEKLYKTFPDLPQPTQKHDHRPDNDACVIAFEQQALFKIQNDLKK